MSVILAENNYGKQAVRLVTVRRRPAAHELQDVTVAIRLQGDYTAAFQEGDNGGVLPTDTMKNTVYALAAEHPFDDVEDLGLRLTGHVLRENPRVTRATVELTEHLWERIENDGTPHPHAFRRAGGEQRTALVVRDRAGEAVRVQAGLQDLVVMKTARSAFAGFPRDRYTTLKETTDRLLATAVRATWWYTVPAVPFGARWHDVRRHLLATFADHDSLSVQQTLYAMGAAVLEGVPDVEEIHLSMPNKHHIPVDLTPFGLENRNEIFVATAEPYGLIEATVRRG
ncbi:MAG TPA: urate oxidase [Acidobacteria bacterium]|nr:urate oxidase [Acidobacteriota bacterium]